MDLLHKIVNGEKVFLSQEESDALRAKWAASDAKRAEARAKFGYIQDRKKAYAPIGDQLDAIWKQLAYMRLNGVDLAESTDIELGKYLAVKRAFPKPDSNV